MTSGQETERVHSYNPGARTGPSQPDVQVVNVDGEQAITDMSVKVRQRETSSLPTDRGTACVYITISAHEGLRHWILKDNNNEHANPLAFT